MKEADHKESWYQAKIIRWLKDTYPHAFIWKAAAGPYSRGGIPDICMILNGQFYGFEVKRPGTGVLSKLQEVTIKEIKAAGGKVAVVSTPEDIQRFMFVHADPVEKVGATITAAFAYQALVQRTQRAEENILTLEKVTGQTIEDITARFLAGYELTPPRRGQ
nr:VRR-NUC domain-containing protein [uncultured Oscillibacter sp.]